MSVAQELGSGTSFGAIARGERRSGRGRAKAIAADEIPRHELVRVRLSGVATSPLNPRRNFGTPEELAAFGEELRRAQLAACVGVKRDAYLRLWPDHASQIPADAEVVLLNGERRLRSGLAAGLEALDFTIRDDLAETREEFLENLLKENLDRKDFDLIERARGVAAMVELCGDQVRAAEKFGKDKSWVTNQLVLLVLPAEVQEMLSAGLMPERHGRVLARRFKKEPLLSAADLLAHWEAIKDEEEQARIQRKEDARLAREQRLSMDNRRPTVAAESGESRSAAAPEGMSPQLSMDNSAVVVMPAARSAVSEAAPLPREGSPQLSMDNSAAMAPAPAAPAPGPGPASAVAPVPEPTPAAAASGAVDGSPAVAQDLYPVKDATVAVNAVIEAYSLALSTTAFAEAIYKALGPDEAFKLADSLAGHLKEAARR